MTNLLLYGAVVVIWGSSWIGIRLQLGVVPPEVSIAYRFMLAAAIMWAFGLLARRRMRVPLAQHPWLAAQGLFLFGLNYIFVYFGSQYLASGLVSVLFSILTVFNIVNAALFFGSPLQGRILIGAAVGLLGIVLVFAPEVRSFDLTIDSLKGLAWCLGGTFFASLGMMVSLRNLRNGLPVIEANTWGMSYGALFVSLIALAEGKPFIFDPAPAYGISLGFLALFSTVIGFVCYLSLQGRIGPERTAYTSVLFPIIALAISTVYEDYQWSWSALSGVVLVLWGNVVILTPAGRIAGWLKRAGATS